MRKTLWSIVLALLPIVAAAQDDLRGDPSPHAAELRARLHTALRRLCDREVELLADVIEAPRT